MKGWSYLHGQRWEDITRDERFFCQRLYALASDAPRAFVRILNRLSPELALDEAAEWEIGYEVCFFRDLRYSTPAGRRDEAGYSQKRTFDLCLFSERRILIVEAKAQQSFDSDVKQREAFRREPALVREALGREDIEVGLLLIASGLYLTQDVRRSLRAEFGATPVAWSDLAGAYGGDRVLSRADSVFERPGSGLNNEGHKTGEQLLAAWLNHEKLLVGRQGGLAGAHLQEDIRSGAWRTRMYETRTDTSPAPNANWFALQHFGKLVASEDGSDGVHP